MHAHADGWLIFLARPYVGAGTYYGAANNAYALHCSHAGSEDDRSIEKSFPRDKSMLRIDRAILH